MRSALSPARSTLAPSCFSLARCTPALRHPTPSIEARSLGPHRVVARGIHALSPLDRSLLETAGMTKRAVSLLTVASLVLAAACGGSIETAPGSETPDASSPETTTGSDGSAPGDATGFDVTHFDGGPHDTGIDSEQPADAGRDSGPVDTGIGVDAPVDTGVDAGPQPVGTQLQPGNSLTLWGVTSDGFAIYTDDVAQMLYAAPLGGGPAVSIAPVSATRGTFYYGLTFNKVALMWSGIGQSSLVGTLIVWSSSGGAHTLSTASRAFLAAVSADSQHLVYLDHATSQGTGDMLGAAVDGSGVTTLLAGLGDFQNCFPYPIFAGSNAAVVPHCDNPDAGFSGATVSAFAPPSWTRTDLFTNVYPSVNTDPAGAQILASGSAGLLVAPIGGGSSTLIDPIGAYGFFTSDGMSVIYNDNNGALKRSPIASPAPVTLVAGGVFGLLGLSPDQSTALSYQNFDPRTYLTDLDLASIVSPGPITVLSSAPTAAVPGSYTLGNPFTEDSSHALYYTSFNVMSYVGTLNAFDVNTSSPSVLGTNSTAAWASGPSKVVFSDNYVSLGGTSPAVDLESVDTNLPAGPTHVVSGANPQFYMSPAADQIVYTWSWQSGPLAGLYVVPVP